MTQRRLHCITSFHSFSRFSLLSYLKALRLLSRSRHTNTSSTRSNSYERDAHQPLSFLCPFFALIHTTMPIMRITILFVSISSLLIVSVELFAPVPERTRPIRPNTIWQSNVVRSQQPSSATLYAHAPFHQELEHHHHPLPSWLHGVFPRRRPPPRSPLVALQQQQRQQAHAATIATLPPQHPRIRQQPQPTTMEQEKPVLSLFEKKCLLRLEKLYSKALSMKCPFLRRRATDALDALEAATRSLLSVRTRVVGGTRGRLSLVDRGRSSLEHVLGPPMGLRCKGKTCIKYPPGSLSMQQRHGLILQDWKVDTHKGYYITGRLNTALYRDDCLFDGPDPDMPIRGLRKYLDVARQLFDQNASRSELLSLEIMDDVDDNNNNNNKDENSNNNNNNNSSPKSNNTIVARWKMNGILRLPWHPRLPEWTGQTTYHFDNDGLVYLHTETWDLSVAQAFVSTLLPEVAQRLWPTTTTPRIITAVDNDNDDKRRAGEEDVCQDACSLV